MTPPADAEFHLLGGQRDVTAAAFRERARRAAFAVCRSRLLKNVGVGNEPAAFENCRAGRLARRTALIAVTDASDPSRDGKSERFSKDTPMERRDGTDGPGDLSRRKARGKVHDHDPSGDERSGVRPAAVLGTDGGSDCRQGPGGEPGCGRLTRQMEPGERNRLGVCRKVRTSLSLGPSGGRRGRGGREGTGTLSGLPSASRVPVPITRRWNRCVASARRKSPEPTIASSHALTVSDRSVYFHRRFWQLPLRLEENLPR